MDRKGHSCEESHLLGGDCHSERVAMEWRGNYRNSLLPHRKRGKATSDSQEVMRGPTYWTATLESAEQEATFRH